ncbi:MAG: hypothetical protein IPN77_18865 [Sandaracinaceae bacterium]|nr:hypothetical protein [Sandaracinaceae bacterium]
MKNTSGSVDSDRIDREVGAAAGTGATHILFVAPRSTLTGPARKEALVRSRLTSLHVYFLDERYFGASIDIVKILDELKLQARRVAGSKRAEARGRLE